MSIISRTTNNELVSGPYEWEVWDRASAAYLPLGLVEDNAPEVVKTVESEPVFSDALGGSMIDFCYRGGNVTVSMVFNQVWLPAVRWIANPFAMRSISDYLNASEIDEDEMPELQVGVVGSMAVNRVNPVSTILRAKRVGNLTTAKPDYIRFAAATPDPLLVSRMQYGSVTRRRAFRFQAFPFTENLIQGDPTSAVAWWGRPTENAVT